MSPNDYQTQNITPLPEVPQIAQSDTTPPTAQSFENTLANESSPEATKPSNEAPAPIQPTPKPVVAPVFTPTSTPMSMFSDIRPAQPNPAPSTSATPPMPAPVFNDIKPTQTTPYQSPVPAPQASPVSNPPLPTQAPVPTQSAPTTSSAVKKPRKAVLLIGAIGSVVVLAGVAAVVFLLVLPNLGKISSSDLVSAASAGTSYLHPKQWKEAALGSTSGYGEKISGSDKYSSLIVSEKLSYLQSGVNKSSDKQIAGFRQLMVKLNSSADAEATLKKSGACDSVKDVNVTESTVKNTNSVGIFNITGICAKGKVSYKIAYYALLGNDGYARAITLIATESSWKQNEAVFNKMLDSAEQA